ncbi:DUF4249 domain-containing protein [Phaeodactylibacter luteus]|uniref:DUF4249 domain-containing protein n=1 Tax=Phaeodactylibacter luteus TaxID=1564516 RepID=A0A5C6RRK2_9BACT|nr:DUF4249 domain-containing protein [Phaeodactylibacter luteus]TXB64908.1 DUF4249 domain-containing protein [Phaeodactylibacter luteus]
MKNFGFALLLLLFWGCEKEFLPDVANVEPALVVEGYIEAGSEPRPAFVVLSKALPFFSEFNADDFSGNFIRGAEVRVSDGQDTVTLTEVCLEDLTPVQKSAAGELLGLNLDSIGFNFCAYLDLGLQLPGQAGKTYTLWVEAPPFRAQAVTTIPLHVPIDSLRFRENPGEPVDTLAQLVGYIQDPPSVANFYRYQVGINGGAIASPAASVVDDRLFDGDLVEFPLLRPQPRGETEFDFSTFGLYETGDTVTVKWITLDEAHYNFWNTVEFNTANQGPFSSYTLIESNVEGGFGIWGGLSASYYTLEVKK